MRVIFCGKKSIKILWFYVPRALFSGQKPDSIYLVYLTLVIRVVLLSSAVYVVLATESLSWLSSTISSELWAFGGPHVMEADFNFPKPLPYSYLWLEWWISNTNSPFKSVLIANDSFQSVHQPSPPPPTPPPPPQLLNFNFHCHIMRNE